MVVPKILKLCFIRAFLFVLLINPVFYYISIKLPTWNFTVLYCTRWVTSVCVVLYQGHTVNSCILLFQWRTDCTRWLTWVCVGTVGQVLLWFPQWQTSSVRMSATLLPQWGPVHWWVSIAKTLVVARNFWHFCCKISNPCLTVYLKCFWASNNFSRMKIVHCWDVHFFQNLNI